MNLIETESFNLIAGQFTEEEAKDIIMQVFLKKINFHERKDFSSLERYGKGDKKAQERILVLKREMERANEVIASSKAKNKILSISAEIKITWLKD